MPAATNRRKQPIILMVTPHQIETKFLTQKDSPQINARLKVRRKKGEQPLELQVTISNPFFKGEVHNQEDQEGGRLIKSKKLRKKLQQGSLVLQAGALGAAALGQPELAAPLEAAALSSQAMAGMARKAASIVKGAGPPPPGHKLRKLCN